MVFWWHGRWVAALRRTFCLHRQGCDLTMQAASSSEMSVLVYHTIEYHIPPDRDFGSYQLMNLKSYTI